MKTVFCGDISPTTDNGHLFAQVATDALFGDTDTAQIGFIPVVATEVGMRLADTHEAKTILDAFSSRNEALQDGTWRDGWHAFCEQMRPWYTKIAANACTEAGGVKSVEFFAHYLDCEAHTDVWRELFPTRNHTNDI